MGEILGVGVTHYPPLMGDPARYADLLRRSMKSAVVPDAVKDERTWPAEARREYANEPTLAAEHQQRLIADFRKVRKAIDDFEPDTVIIFGDDQYENFREDLIPPFCVFLFDKMESKPFAGRRMFGSVNPWEEPEDKLFVHQGNKPLGMHIATELIERGFPVPYSLVNSHYAQRGGPTMLTHAFLDALLYLDWDRKGFPYRIVPIQVNCYGKQVVPYRGGAAHLNPATKLEPFGDEFGPPGPTPASLFKLGKMVREVLETVPGRFVVMASSGWSHGSLVEKTGYMWPDLAFDRQHVRDLEEGRHDRWAALTNAQIDAAGDQEFKNWICLAGAMEDRKGVVVDYLENYIFHSTKCFALFPPGGGAR